MSLNLGKRINGTSIPSYGKNGLIQGMLTVTSFDHVKEVSVTVESSMSMLTVHLTDTTGTDLRGSRYPCLGSLSRVRNAP